MRSVAILLFGVLSASVVVADPVDDAIALFRRQSVPLSTGGSDTTESTSDTTSFSSFSSPTSDTTTPTSTPPTTSETVFTTSSVVTLPGSSSDTVVVVTSTSTQTPSSSAQPSSSVEPSTNTVTETTSASKTLITSSSFSQVVTTITSVESGSTIHLVSTTSSAIPITTAVDPASLTSNGKGGSSGLSSTAKATIGGVIGGVGGALLLAGLAYTAWRVWGKKKTLHDDDLYDPNVNQDKLSGTTADSTPFRSTLDQYHQPGPVNTASNF